MSESHPTIEGDDVHLRWMREAMRMVRHHPIVVFCRGLRITQAEEAMAAKEVPVGCVFVRGNRIIAKARNRTNELRNVRPPFLTVTPTLHPNAENPPIKTRQQDTQS